MATLRLSKLAIPQQHEATIASDVSPIRTSQDLAFRSTSPISPITAFKARRPGHQPSTNGDFASTVVKGCFSEEDLIDIPENTIARAAEWAKTTEHEYDLRASRIQADDLLLDLHGPAMIVERHFEHEEEVRSTAGERQRDGSLSSATSRSQQRRSVSTDASHKAERKSWLSIATTTDSRSPSPSGGERNERRYTGSPLPVTWRGSARRSAQKPSKQSDTHAPADEQDDASTIKTDHTAKASRSPRPGTPNRRATSTNLSTESGFRISGLPKSFSTDKLPILRTIVTTQPIPHAQHATTTTIKKDELWSAFRSLDAEHGKFASKSPALKANVVRSVVMPFLQKPHNHALVHVLRAEDLERRGVILDKWWTALIEMLHGRYNQSIIGTDRPVLLDAIAGIMERAEWRLHPSSSPLKHKVTTSKRGAQDQSARDAVIERINNMFVQNLRAQMIFVVEKMSLRQASASLVAFCGKACTYAFMFVPGMADVLVRLWHLQSPQLRRVLAEHDVDRLSNLSQLSEAVLAHFPDCLNSLGFTTLAQFKRKLHAASTPPVGTADIQWWGFWLERWNGHEGDLFYVFTKYYHILVSDFLPPNASKAELMCVPGMLPVHCQMLKNLDSTVHRKQDKNTTSEAIAALHAMDDAYAGPDAIASAIPVPPNNAARPMAENRLIVLARDFMGEVTVRERTARHLFAQTFNNLLQAVTQGISVHDTPACYALLDLLEEALVILAKHEATMTGTARLIELDFWHLMSRRMISDDNTLVEVRLYAFLYTTWNALVGDALRRADICLGLLLDPVVFASRFNHWCPMVRAYYMRLLCWRVGRFDGDAANDIEILQALHHQLHVTWSHYLWLRDVRLERGEAPPETSPSNPAIFRRLRIVRCEPLSIPGSLAASPVDGSLSAQTRRLRIAAERTTHQDDESRDRPGSIRGLLRKAISNKERSSSQDNGTSAGRATRSAYSLTHDMVPSRGSSLTGTHLALEAPNIGSFKFAFEYNQNIKAPRPLWLAPPLLPAPAQRRLEALIDDGRRVDILLPREPRGIARKRATYTGRALAEWTLVVGECHKFYERRRNEGIAEDRLVETPALSVDIFRRAF